VEPFEQRGRTLAAAVGVPTAERGQMGLVETGGGLWGRVLGQERQGDLGGGPEEDLLGARPMGVQQRPELVAGGSLGGDVVVAQPDQGLQLAGDRIRRLQPAWPVPVGAQVIGELVAVARVGLGAGGAPTRPSSMEGARVDRDDRMTGGQQSSDDQAVAAFDRHRQVGRIAMGGEPGQDGVQVRLGVAERPAVHDHAAGVEDRHGVAGAGPVPSDEQHGGLPFGRRQRARPRW